jgi:hypothetical protein
VAKENEATAFNNQIEVTGNNLGGFSKADCPCASFLSLNLSPANHQFLSAFIFAYS